MIKDSKPRAKILVLTAPLGTGKTTVAKALAVDERFTINVSTTSRPPRAGEADGRDYVFVSAPEFKKRLADGEFVEYSITGDNYYGVSAKYIADAMAGGKILICALDWNGLRALKAKYPADTVGVFMKPPNKYELLIRLKNRGTSDEEIDRRMATYDEYMEHAREYDFVLVNNDVSRTAATIADLVFGTDTPGAEAISAAAGDA
ncbi:guanylate kinase [Alphaproteobacteria bacterium]|nr:guanylate kinase [Alphaproteobacteria bacterium]